MANEKFLYVRSALQDNRVGMHEVDPRHPGGSVTVDSTRTYKVAATPFALQRLRDGFLEEATVANDKKAADKWATDRDEGNPVSSVDRVSSADAPPNPAHANPIEGREPQDPAMGIVLGEADASEETEPENYADMNVAQLKEELARRDIEFAHNERKERLIQLLEEDDDGGDDTSDEEDEVNG